MSNCKCTGHRCHGARILKYHWLYDLQKISFQIKNNIAYVASTSSDAIYAVALDSGNNWIIADDTTGTGPALGFLESIIFDNTENVLYVSDDVAGVVLSVNIATGNRQILSGSSEALPIKAARAMGFDPINKRIFVADAAVSNIYVIDIESGERAIFLH